MCWCCGALTCSSRHATGGVPPTTTNVGMTTQHLACIAKTAVVRLGWRLRCGCVDPFCCWYVSWLFWAARGLCVLCLVVDLNDGLVCYFCYSLTLFLLSCPVGFHIVFLGFPFLFFSPPPLVFSILSVSSRQYPGKCLTTETPLDSQCSASHPLTRRLCPCSLKR